MDIESKRNLNFGFHTLTSNHTIHDNRKQNKKTHSEQGIAIHKALQNVAMRIPRHKPPTSVLVSALQRHGVTLLRNPPHEQDRPSARSNTSTHVCSTSSALMQQRTHQTPTAATEGRLSGYVHVPLRCSKDELLAYITPQDEPACCRTSSRCCPNSARIFFSLRPFCRVATTMALRLFRRSCSPSSQ